MGRTGVRRTVLAGILVFCLVPAARAVASSGPSGASAAAASGRVGPTATYVVRPGDTIWGIALRYSRGSDALALVDEIESANRVAPGDLRPGEALVIPRA